MKFLAKLGMILWSAVIFGKIIGQTDLSWWIILWPLTLALGLFVLWLLAIIAVVIIDHYQSKQFRKDLQRRLAR